MEEKVKKIMAQVFRVDAASIVETTVQKDIATWDSLAHINMIVAFEEEFGVQLQDDQIIQMISYQAILSMLKTAGQGAP